MKVFNVLFQIIRADDGVRTAFVTQTTDVILDLLYRCNQNDFINVVSLDCDLADSGSDTRFGLFPLMRVSTFIRDFNSIFGFDVKENTDEAV